MAQILMTTVREEIPCSKRRLETWATVTRRAKKAKSSLADQTGTRKISLAAFLYARKMLDVDGAPHIGLVKRQDVKHLLMFYSEREDSRREMLKVADPTTASASNN